MNSSVDILLAVYNAERYLKQQLDSIQNQSHRDWYLIIGDDCSSDNTASMLAGEEQLHGPRIRVIPTSSAPLGASQNFARLMTHSTSPYLMFCDQDDVWLPGKIENTLAKMMEMETKYGETTPILVHTDLKVVDENLGVISESLWEYQWSDPAGGSSLNRLLLQNVATGCTVMVNRPLLDLAQPIPDVAMMHDWWLALVAAAFGKIGHIAEPTILYRQHGANDTGAKGRDLAEIFRLCSTAGKRREFFAGLDAADRRLHCQAEAFWDRYENRLAPCQKQLLQSYLRLPTSNLFMKRYYTVRYGLWYTGLTRNLVHLLIL